MYTYTVGIHKYNLKNEHFTLFKWWLSLDLVERKREEAARRQAADLDRKKVMELEEALSEGCKRRQVPREVSMHVCGLIQPDSKWICRIQVTYLLHCNCI